MPTVAVEEGELTRTILGGRADVEDTVQQTTPKASTHLDQFRGEASLKTWLIRIGLKEGRHWQRTRAASWFLALHLSTLTKVPVVDEGHSPLDEYQRSVSKTSVFLKSLGDWGWRYRR